MTVPDHIHYQELRNAISCSDVLLIIDLHWNPTSEVEKMVRDAAVKKITQLRDSYYYQAKEQIKSC